MFEATFNHGEVPRESAVVGKQGQEGCRYVGTCMLCVVPMTDVDISGDCGILPHKTTVSQVACCGSHELRRRGTYSSHHLLCFPG